MAAETPPPPGEAPAQAAVDPELLLEFSADAIEAADACDLALLALERNSSQPEPLAKLTHALDGVRAHASSSGLDQVVLLAVSARDLVQLRIDGIRRLDGPGVDALFDAVVAVRAFVDDLYAYLDGGRLPDGEEFLPIIQRLRALKAGEAVPEAALPTVEPGQKLGEILIAPPFDVPPSAIERALESQVKSGRRLGEELVATHLVDAAKVAHALRAQARVGHGGDAGAARQASESVKVDQARLDRLMEALGELVVIESTMRNVEDFRGAASEAARRCLSQLAKVTRDLTDAGTRLRMQPADGMFQRIVRTVRELSRRGGRQVRLVTQGDATEMDRVLVEQLVEPLLALVRTSMALGFEDRATREQAHKQSRGTIRLAATIEAGNVVLEVADDGAGLDRDALLRAAAARGVAIPAGAAVAPLEALLFTPGFWPPPDDPDGAGPLLALETVKLQVEALRGRFHVITAAGAGTTYRMIMPLALTTVDAMLVACGQERFLIPTLAVVESIRPTAGMVVTQGGRTEMLSMRGSVLPLVRLDRLLQVPGARQDPTEALVVVLEASDRRFGLLVDDVVAQQHVVIKGLGEGLGKVDLFAGAGIHGSGQVGLILSMTAVARRVSG